MGKSETKKLFVRSVSGRKPSCLSDNSFQKFTVWWRVREISGNTRDDIARHCVHRIPGLQREFPRCPRTHRRTRIGVISTAREPYRLPRGRRRARILSLLSLLPPRHVRGGCRTRNDSFAVGGVIFSGVFSTNACSYGTRGTVCVQRSCFEHRANPGAKIRPDTGTACFGGFCAENNRGHSDREVRVADKTLFC